MDLLLAAIVFGWVDATIIALGLVALAWVIRRPEPVRPTTAIILTAVTAIALWANLRPTGAEYGYGDDHHRALGNLDPVTKALFWRGWPLSPYMLCPDYHLTFHPEGAFIQQALVYDAVLILAALVAVRFLCERCFGRRRGPGKAPDRAQRARTPVFDALEKGLFWGVVFGVMELALYYVWQFHIGCLLDMRDARARNVYESVERIETILNAPAYWLRDWWWRTWLYWAGRGPGFFFAVLIEWALIGMVVGLVVALWGKRGGEKLP